MIINKYNRGWPAGLRYLLMGLVLVTIVTSLQVGYWVFVADTWAQGATPHNVYFMTLYALVLVALGAGLCGARRWFGRLLGVASGLNVLACTLGVVSWMRGIVWMYQLQGGQLGTWLGDMGMSLGWSFTCLGLSAACLITLVRVEWFAPRAPEPEG